MSIHVTRAPTVPFTSYDTKRSSHLKEENCQTLAIHSTDCSVGRKVHQNAYDIILSAKAHNEGYYAARDNARRRSKPRPNRDEAKA